MPRRISLRIAPPIKQRRLVPGKRRERGSSRSGQRTAEAHHLSGCGVNSTLLAGMMVTSAGPTTSARGCGNFHSSDFVSAGTVTKARNTTRKCRPRAVQRHRQRAESLPPAHCGRSVLRARRYRYPSRQVDVELEKLVRESCIESRLEHDSLPRTS